MTFVKARLEGAAGEEASGSRRELDKFLSASGTCYNQHSPPKTAVHSVIFLLNDMNWTGGSLQRTKNARKGVRQAQKAYFARVRTNLQNEAYSPGAPFRPSELREDEKFGGAANALSLENPSVNRAGHLSQAQYRSATQRDSTHRTPSNWENTKGLERSLDSRNAHRLVVSDAAELGLGVRCRPGESLWDASCLL